MCVAHASSPSSVPVGRGKGTLTPLVPLSLRAIKAEGERRTGAYVGTRVPTYAPSSVLGGCPSPATPGLDGFPPTRPVLLTYQKCSAFLICLYQGGKGEVKTGGCARAQVHASSLVPRGGDGEVSPGRGCVGKSEISPGRRKDRGFRGSG